MKTNTNTAQNNNNTKSNNKKITNWHQYGLSLGRRGSFMALLDMAEKWGAFKVPSRTYNPGRPRKYSDELIVLILIFHELYRLPLRQSITFTSEIMMARIATNKGQYIALPDYSTVSRRAAELNISILPDNYCLCASEAIDLLVDSSGFCIHGEGNWFRRKHGIHQHRMWQETHIGVDYRSRLILSVINTPNNIQDNTQLFPLILNVERNLRKAHTAQRLNSIIGDKAYDAKDNYNLVKQFGAEFISPPKQNATEHINMYHYRIYDTPGWEGRNAAVRHIEEFGLDGWMADTDYHRRSLVENAFYRIKTIFGDKMLLRTNENRNTEQLIRVKILNIFTMYGLPKYS